MPTTTLLRWYYGSFSYITEGWTAGAATVRATPCCAPVRLAQPGGCLQPIWWCFKHDYCSDWL